MIKIAVDIQGADNNAQDLVGGVMKALADNPDLYIYLCGDKSVIMSAMGAQPERLEVIDAPQIITNDDNPMSAVMSKKNSSLVKGLELCKNNSEIAAFVTCGATGAVFIAAMFMLEKVAKSPTLLCALRKVDGAPFCIADCGANVDCRPERIEDFARVGSAYLKAYGIDNPRIALLSNGAENAKGNKFIKQVNDLLSASGLNFIGNVEGSDALNAAGGDVIVCDGFSGNVMLKTIEGSAKAAVEHARMLLDGAKLAGAEEFKSILDEVYRAYDYTTQGGATLLGFKIPIVKGHGAATAETVYHVIGHACELVEKNIVEKIKNEFASACR